jgi:hypothetical protein
VNTMNYIKHASLACARGTSTIDGCARPPRMDHQDDRWLVRVVKVVGGVGDDRMIDSDRD